jgi:hypothetical protein
MRSSASLPKVCIVGRVGPETVDCAPGEAGVREAVLGQRLQELRWTPIRAGGRGAQCATGPLLRSGKEDAHQERRKTGSRINLNFSSTAEVIM